MIENFSLPHGEKLVDFAARSDALRRDRGPAWFESLKNSAEDVIKEQGFPHPKLESWEFSQVRKILGEVYEGSMPLIKNEEVAKYLDIPMVQKEIPSLVLVNGGLEPALSDLSRLPRGVHLVPFPALGRSSKVLEWFEEAYSVQEAEDSFTGINLMMSKDPLILFVEPGVQVTQEIQVISLASGGTYHRGILNPSLFLLAGSGSVVSISEIHLGMKDDHYFSNSFTALSLEEGSRVRHVKVIAGGDGSYHLGRIKAELEERSDLKTHTIMGSGGVNRNELKIDLNGTEARADLFGLYLGKGRQQLENSTCIRHNKPECLSREHYKGIMDGRSRALFRGRIIVAEGAQKTDSEQTNNNLLLSPDARINSKPQLEIYADDVSCTHGATVGQLEEEKLFYLRSRGISRDVARKLLVKAFGNEIVSKIDSENLREALEDLFLDELAVV